MLNIDKQETCQIYVVIQVSIKIGGFVKTQNSRGRHAKREGVESILASLQERLVSESKQVKEL
jgi:ribosomal protein L15E